MVLTNRLEPDEVSEVSQRSVLSTKVSPGRELVRMRCGQCAEKPGGEESEESACNKALLTHIQMQGAVPLPCRTPRMRRLALVEREIC